MFGSNLNPYKFIEVLEAETASELRDLIKGIRIPNKILGFVYDAKRKKHVVYMNTQRKINRS